MANIYNAIVFRTPDKLGKKRKPMKFRKVGNLKRFTLFMKNDIEGAKYANMYFAKTREYSHRIYIN